MNADVVRVRVIRNYGSFTSFLVCIALAQLLAECTGQLPVFGSKCLEKPAPTNPIDLNRFSGKWFDVESTPILVRWPWKCVTLNLDQFFERKSKLTIQVKKRMDRLLQEVPAITVDVSIPDNSTDKDGKLNVAFHQIECHNDLYCPQRYFRSNRVRILATDYSNWAIVWSCSDVEKFNAHTEFLWILSRTPLINPEVYGSALEAMKQFKVDHIVTRFLTPGSCSIEEMLHGNGDFDELKPLF